MRDRAHVLLSRARAPTAHTSYRTRETTWCVCARDKSSSGGKFLYFKKAHRPQNIIYLFMSIFLSLEFAFVSNGAAVRRAENVWCTRICAYSVYQISIEFCRRCGTTTMPHYERQRAIFIAITCAILFSSVHSKNGIILSALATINKCTHTHTHKESLITKASEK